MIWRAAAVLSLIASPAFSDSSVTLADTICPFVGNEVPNDHSATCSRMTWVEDSITYRTVVALVTPDDSESDAVPVVYIPGGPGDAPVNEGVDLASILNLFPGRPLITLNPRGVKGAEPRPTCKFDPDFWDEEIAPEREDEMTAGCRDAVDLDLSKMDAPYLAKDIDNMIGALKIKRANLFAISYGTESALHLLTQQPDWLGSVILDSVSMPGALGTRERLMARDRFLGVIDRICFAEKQCQSNVVDQYDDLLDWVGQFDKKPLKLTIGPPDATWSLDGQEMLDFLSSLAAYPDGAGYAPLFIEAFESSRRDTGKWVASELENGFDYARRNFALLYNAFSDSAERNDATPKIGSTKYPFNVDEQQAFSRLFNVWNKSGRTETRFINANTKPQPAGVPVLILSGGVDSLTPVSWGLELEKRFSGTTHFVFPELAHAVAFGTDADVQDQSVAHQLRCGPRVVRAFAAGKPFGDCSQFLREKNP